MPRPVASLRACARISDLCPIFTATLHPVWEEGFPLHQMHFRPVPVCLGEEGALRLMLDRRLASVFGVQRTSPLLAHMMHSLKGLEPPPLETLCLELPVEDATLPFRAAVVREASERLATLMDREETVHLVTISHRRSAQGALVIRHHLVALLDLAGALLWCHPAAAGYGLLRPGFPEHQEERTLGTPGAWLTPGQFPRRLDPATGLPAWFLYAQRQCADVMFERAGWDIPWILAAQADLWVAHGVVRDREAARREVVQDFIQGFEGWFGSGGLQPTPTLLLP